MKVIAAIPYRPDNGQRTRIWSHLQHDFWPHTNAKIKLSWHTDGPFNRAKAINKALDCAWHVAIIADSDTWVPLGQLAQAVYLASTNSKLVAAFTEVHELNPVTTERLMSMRMTTLDTERVRTKPLETQSSMLAIGRDLWNRVGGMDERFKGWGGEDNAFWKACTLHGGEPLRVNGPAYHMWHPPAQGKHTGPNYRANRELWNRYQQATTIKDLSRC